MIALLLAAGLTGQALFYEHTFGATPASLPVKVYEAIREVQGWDPDAFGLIRQPGRELPVGFVSSPSLGVDRISFNCSLCHTGRVGGQVLAGQPNLDLDLQGFQDGVFDALAHKGDRIQAAIDRRHPRLSLAEGLQLRLWLALAKGKAEQRRPSPERAGPGRFDLLGSFKERLGLPMHRFNAQMDIPALYGVRSLTRYPRDGALGGNQDLVRYLIVRLSGDSSPLVGGQVPGWVRQLNGYLATLEPPRYPYPIDRGLAGRGHQVFGRTCAGCHGTYAPDPLVHPNRIVPIGVVGTDPQRLAVWDDAAVAYARRDPIMRQLDLQPGVGFVPPSLRGVWATAPYLHNGSVPTLHALLGDPAARPKAFYRGHQGFDPVNVGIPAGSGSFRYDTGVPGNGNGGHPFGMPLSEAERMAVIEYLKTL